MKSNLMKPFVRATFFAFSVLLMAVSTSPAQSADDQRRLQVQPSVNRLPGNAKRYALIVGVDEYQDSQINKLTGASNDAKALADALVKYAGFPGENVILLTSNQAVELQPTRANILRRLSNLRQVVPKDGLLLFSFAGHGIERNGRAYLLPMDAQVSTDIALLEDSAINVEAMRDRIRQTNVGQVLLILDACRNNPTTGRGESRSILTRTYTDGFNFDLRNQDITAFATLYATGVGQAALEFKDKKQGYFTWALVEGMRGAAANSKGEVTLAGLVKYVQETVPKRVAIDYGAGERQYPWADIQGYKADELVLAVAGSTVSAVSTTPPARVDPAAVELSFWETIKDSNDPEDFKAYLEKYPNGTFAGLARRRAYPTPSDPARKTTPTRPANPRPAEPGAAVTAEVARILDRYIQSVGGKTAIENVTSVSASGDFEIPTHGTKGTLLSFTKAPDKAYSKITVPGVLTITQGYDGKVGWIQDTVNGVREKKSLELEGAKLDSVFYNQTKLREMYSILELIGTQAVGARQAHVILATTPSGISDKYYFDTQTGLLIRQDSDRTAPEGRTLTETYYEDYTSVCGILLPSVFRSVSPQITTILKIKTFDCNKAINDTMFIMPRK
ncbi:MAG: caspase family protein [Acidobacteriota bacterium]